MGRSGLEGMARSFFPLPLPLQCDVGWENLVRLGKSTRASLGLTLKREPASWAMIRCIRVVLLLARGPRKLTHSTITIPPVWSMPLTLLPISPEPGITTSASPVVACSPADCSLTDLIW